MLNSFWRGAAIVLVLSLPLAAHAGAVDALKRFLDQTKSFSAEFSLSVRSESGRPMDSSGKVAIQKPGKFRWEVEKPYFQLMVGNGQQIWIYDPDLMQVSIRKMDQTMGATPVALLAGSRDILKNFELSEAGDTDGLAWAEAQPRNQESGFVKVRLGFAPGGDLKAMELFDNFGQTTTVRFHQSRINSRFSDSHFHFTPPEGVEVLEE
jgi:outer membrane lipoprotein carrier protein